MSRRRGVACLAVALTLVGAASASARPYQSFYSVINQFMCVECHEPLSQVNSPEALSEKTTLRALIKRDLTLSQIKAGMVAQYGEQVLARPPASGFNLAVYILPPAIFLGGLALLAYTLPKWRERSRRAASTRLPGAPPLQSDDAQRLDDELSHFI
jgi:cytochrome c-type biogenesis protein CcmH/NrfF